MAEVKIARTAFVCEVNGSRIQVRKGALVRDGHGVMKGRQDLFRSLEDSIDFEVEQPKITVPKKAKKVEVLEPTPEPDPED